MRVLTRIVVAAALLAPLVIARRAGGEPTPPSAKSLGTTSPSSESMTSAVRIKLSPRLSLTPPSLVVPARGKLELDPPELVARHVPRFQLLWPRLAAHWSFSAIDARSTWNAPVPLYYGEAQWFQRGPASLWTVNYVEESSELECSLECQPVIERSVGAEARLELGGGGRIPETHAFLRGDTLRQRHLTSQRLRLGLAGTLDF